MDICEKNKIKNQTNFTKGKIQRRGFIKKSFVAIAGISTVNIFSCTSSSKNNDTIRVIAYNVLKCTGWPPENVMKGTHMPTLIAEELSKYSPNLINFSESPEESIVKEIASQLNMNFVWFSSGGNWPGAILTNFEIIDSTNVPILSGIRPKDLFTRHWGKAKLKIARDKSLIVHSAHLFPHDTPEAGAIRKQEISEILLAMQKDMSEDNSIILMGDLNHRPDMPEYSQWMKANLVDTFIEAGRGNGFTVLPDNPKRRIDYIMSFGPISKNINESRALFEGKFRTNPTDPNSFALSDHLPQFAEFGFDKSI